MAELLYDGTQLDAEIRVMAEAIRADVKRPEDAAILGIRTRGADLGVRVGKILAEEMDLPIPVGVLDITLYRDDLSTLAINPLVRKTELDFDVEGRIIYLVDDVLYTGRTVRSAIDEIMDFGRPSAIRLACLVVREGRELPIQADIAPVQVKTEPQQVIKVCLQETDGEHCIWLTTREEMAAKLAKKTSLKMKER